MRRLTAIFIFVGSVFLYLGGDAHPVPSLAQAVCGTERWPVKIGTDLDAASVNLAAPTETTIAQLVALPKPRALPDKNRIVPTETTAFVVTATLFAYKLEVGDSDYHLALRDASGKTMIAEIPAPDCALGSPFAAQIAQARAKFDTQLHARGSYQNANLTVKLTGIGFFDFIHGQRGVARNGIELHPVLDIDFLGAPTPTPTRTPLPTRTPRPTATPRPTRTPTFTPLPPPAAPQSAQGATCPNLSATCSQLTCDQAYACLRAGNSRLDRDHDGVPCENVCPGG
jgi:hypothetical protein